MFYILIFTMKLCLNDFVDDICCDFAKTTKKRNAWQVNAKLLRFGDTLTSSRDISLTQAFTLFVIIIWSLETVPWMSQLSVVTHLPISFWLITVKSNPWPQRVKIPDINIWLCAVYMMDPFVVGKSYSTCSLQYLVINSLNAAMAGCKFTLCILLQEVSPDGLLYTISYKCAS